MKLPCPLYAVTIPVVVLYLKYAVAPLDFPSIKVGVDNVIGSFNVISV
jgi:hypothetical protein